MKRYVTITIMTAFCATLLMGCGDKGLPLHPGNLPDAAGHSAVYAAQQAESTDNTGADSQSGGMTESVSLAEEFMNLESEYAVLQEKLNQATTQMEMNLVAAESCEFWTEELDSLCERILAATDEEGIALFTEEQQSWTAKLDAEIREAGKDYEGGSMQPLVENMAAAEMTRERCYELATILAVSRGETFTVKYPGVAEWNDGSDAESGTESEAERL